MSNEQMKRIFDQSDCLTSRQLKGYVSGSLVHEEAHAVEAHIMGCPFCKDAVEGIKEHRIDRSIDTMEAITPDFLEGHSGFTNEEVPAAIASSPTIKVAKKINVDRKRFNSPQLLRTISIAATVLIAAGVFWFIQSNSGNDDVTTAQNVTTENVEPVTDQVAIQDKNTTMYKAFDDTVTNSKDQAVAEVALDTIEQPKTLQTVEELAQADASADDVKYKETNKEGETKKPGANKKKDTIEKMPSTVAMTSGGSAKKAPAVDTRGRMGNSYTSTSVQQDDVNLIPPATTQVAPTVAKDKAKPEPAKQLTADELYDQKKYSQALAKYTKQMKTADGKDREDAKLGMAKCYIAMGDKKQAESILRGMLYQNSKRKRQAKRLLKDMGVDDN